MSKSLAELAEKLTEQMAAVEETKAEMLAILTEGKATVVRPAPPAKKPQARKPATTHKADESADDDTPGGNRQPSLKEIVLSILEEGPAELKRIVVRLQEKIKAGEYKSKAKKLTPVVSQALFGLKGEKLVATTKTTDEETGRTRNLYSIAAA